MLFISLSLFGMTACSDGGTNSYEQITPEQAKTIMDTEKDYVIIDARTDEEFAEGHIADAILIPEYEIASRAEKELYYHKASCDPVEFQIEASSLRRDKACRRLELLYVAEQGNAKAREKTS